MNRKSVLKKQNSTNDKNMMMKLGITGSAMTTALVAFIGFSKIPSTPTKPDAQVYIAYQLNNEKAVTFVTDINDKFSRTNSEYPTNVDILKGGRVSNIYGVSSEGSIRDIEKDLHVTPSDERALIQALNRIKGLINEKQKLHAFIVTEGSDDKSTLKKIQNIAEEIANKKPQNFYIYLLGLKPELKIEFSDAFHAIKEIVSSCPNTQYEQCSSLVEKIEE
ncbi:MAG: hypothetical protein RMX96_11675 [Nostoc sp. ChiSLP02]|nr:hypothetical protein [Nostoc sp. DedSLP05]MDZ8103520.1 hypothetical protein [Nostoc sp. DedSLP01]MDZ8185500.1 hypothetical protein [Nostoc sp. ChiSLP02]